MAGAVKELGVSLFFESRSLDSANTYGKKRARRALVRFVITRCGL
jgi:hypothetical protein